MSDFPKSGDIHAARTWLDSRGLVNVFDGWDSDSLLGADKEDILEAVNAVHIGEGAMVWGLLNMARQQPGLNKWLLLIVCKNYCLLPFFIFIFVFLYFSHYP